MSKLAVVLMTFTDEYEQLYESVLAPVLVGCGYEVFKANDSTRTGDIADEVINHILSADIVVAEVSEPNPNVFYELGISHSAGSRTIPIAKSADRLPFYLRHQRILIYTSDTQGRRLLRTNLENFLNSDSSSDPLANPVTHVAGELPKLLIRFKDEMSRLLDERRRMTAFNQFAGRSERPHGLNQEVIVAAANIMLDRRSKIDHTAVAAVLGSSAIGKSLFCAQVASEITERSADMKVSILGTDCYMLSRAERRLKGFVGFNPASHRLEELYRDVLEIVNGSVVQVHPYDHATGDQGAAIIVEPCDILIIEGVQAFYHRLTPITQGLRFFLYADSHTAKELKFLADFLDRGYDLKSAFTHADREQQSYQQHTVPLMKMADFIIEVSDYWEYKGPFPETSWGASTK